MQQATCPLVSPQSRPSPAQLTAEAEKPASSAAPPLSLSPEPEPPLFCLQEASSWTRCHGDPLALITHSLSLSFSNVTTPASMATGFCSPHDGSPTSRAPEIFHHHCLSFHGYPRPAHCPGRFEQLHHCSWAGASHPPATGDEGPRQHGR